MKEIDIVIKYLSNYRFETYKILYSTCFINISNSPLGLYQANINFSKDVYELLSYFEIFFRNKIDMVMTESFGEKWINIIEWRDKQLLQISEAKDKFERKKNTIKMILLQIFNLDFGHIYLIKTINLHCGIKL